MALCAANPFVHPPQGESRLVVIELNDASQRLPRGQCVAVLTRKIQRPVGTSSHTLGVFLVCLNWIGWQ